MLKGNGSNVQAAVADADYLAPTGNGSALTNLNASSLATGTVGTGRLGTGTASSGTFLRGDGTWSSSGQLFSSLTGSTLASQALVVGSGASIKPASATLGEIVATDVAVGSIVYANSTYATNTTVLSTMCPSGATYKAIGGGVTNTTKTILGSEPITTGATGWKITLSAGGQGTAYAVCLRVQ